MALDKQARFDVEGEKGGKCYHLNHRQSGYKAQL